jgi:hypothetical protein
MATRSRGYDERGTELGHLLTALYAVGQDTQSEGLNIASGFFPS